MAKRNRETLKNHFRQGERPTQQAFEDLIDSTLNTLDDGFSGSVSGGIGLAPLSEEGNVISVFRSPGDPDPAWEIAINPNNGELEIREFGNSKAIVTIKQQDNNNTREAEIRLNGNLHIPGRTGSYLSGHVPADGRWHDITGDPERLEEGCWAFEIAAGCGERHKGKYALLTATAMHCFGSRPRIRQTRSNYGIFGNRLCLRWKKVHNKFTARLQIKTYFSYSQGTMIHYQISKLWNNPDMQ